MMTKKISRRLFLKGSAVTACSVAVSGAPANAVASPDEHIATLHDLTKCTGCGECVSACRDENKKKYPKVQKPFPKMVPERVRVEDWSEKQSVEDRLTPYNWLYIQEAEVETNHGETTIYIPRRCMHCINPPCVKLCPWGAAKQKQNGLSAINSNTCLGGAKCRTVCPWGIPQRQTGVGLYLDILPSLAGNGVMYKCDRCYHRIEKGEQPSCLEACPEGSQIIGKRSDIIKVAYRLAKEINGYVYGDTENGGTNTIYVSPVPFNILNEAVEKGKGQPDLLSKKNAMAAGNNITTALFLAPFAGIAAAVLNLVAFNKRESEVGNDSE